MNCSSILSISSSYVACELVHLTCGTCEHIPRCHLIDSGDGKSMMNLSQTQTWRAVQNLVPLPYRRVSVQHYDGPMTANAITTLLLSRDAYRRTDFIVLRGEGAQTAVLAITPSQSEPLFSQITSGEVLALPETCVFVERPAGDPANRSALAEVAHELGIGPAGTLVVHALYHHA